MGAHLIDGEFQSDKYPTTPRGKVPLSVKDPTAQDLLWEYAQRRRSVDAEFSDDLEVALVAAGYEHSPGRCLRHVVPCVSEAAHHETIQRQWFDTCQTIDCQAWPTWRVVDAAGRVVRGSYNCDEHRPQEQPLVDGERYEHRQPLRPRTKEEPEQ